MGTQGCASQALAPPYMDPDEWCEYINPAEPYCYQNSCVECIDRGCPIERPFCVRFHCVECEEDINCWEGRVCSPEGKCVLPGIEDCATADDPDSWCMEHEGLPKCDLAGYKCVECIDDIDCYDSTKPFCDLGSCVECKDPGDCSIGEICDHNTCIEGCDPDNPQCPGERPHCSQATGKCEECWSPIHCAPGYACKNYVCVWEGCNKDDSRCPLGYYCPDNDCVEGCRNPENCPGDMPYCSSATGRCEECLSPEHCPDGFDCVKYECIHKAQIPEKHPEECEFPGDCGDNWVCIYGKCYEGCIGTAWCGSETPICNWETTQTIWRESGMGTTYGSCAECSGPEHCAEGYICQGGRCQKDVPEEERECEDDIECEMGVCEHFKCVECRGPENCPDGWHCDNNVCVKGCEGPENCPSDKPICSGALGYCVECTGSPHCPDGYICDNYHCIWEGCNDNDSLCPLGSYCWNNECVDGCRDNNNCPAGRPHCSQATGDCEECLGTPHCPDGYKCDNYICVWFGISCLGDDSKCPEGEWCPGEICVKGCGNNLNCPANRPHCSQATGDCEECLGSPHCGSGQKCVKYRCENIISVCEDKYDCGFGERCRHGTCIDIECYDDPDCDTGWCDDGVCKAYTEECGTGCAEGYICNETTGLCEREECETYRDCDAEGVCCETISGIKRCVPCEAAGCDALHKCRPGWTCDLSTGLCTPKSCASPAGCPDGYICEGGECIVDDCMNMGDPDGYCAGRYGLGWVCDKTNGGCFRVSCDLSSDPDAYCRGYYGANYKCEGKECVKMGRYDFESPDAYCESTYGAYWKWNFVSQHCEIASCDLYDDPDGMCANLYNEWYKCIGGSCQKLGEGDPCITSPECGVGLRCKYGFCHPIECEFPWECGDDETCVDRLCIALGRDCEFPEDCSPGYFCNSNHRCERAVCHDNTECPLDYCCVFPYGAGLNVETQCVPCEEGACTGPESCPLGWECNMETKKCQRRLCDGPEECGEGYKCIHGYCVPLNCANADDPQSFCQKWGGANTTCDFDTGECVARKCNSYSYPYDICAEELGEKYICDWSTGECRYKRAKEFDDLDHYCRTMNGNEWWYWDTENEKCRLPSRCTDVHNPDAFCEETRGAGFRCVLGRCVRGQEGDICHGPEDCARGFTCGDDGLCIKKECYDYYDCGAGRWCDNNLCRDNDNICIDDTECRRGYRCNPHTGRCEQKECSNHYNCDGACCYNGWCIPCEEYPCKPGDCPEGWDCVQGYCTQRECEWDHQCPRGFYCDPATGRCTIEHGYELSRGCRGPEDCAPGEICVGYSYKLGIPDPWYGPPFVETLGVCTDPKKGKVVKIEGIMDDRTCNYCLNKIGEYFYLDEATLPPYHEHCRCWPKIL